MQFIILKNFEDPHFIYLQFSCEIACLHGSRSTDVLVIVASSLADVPTARGPPTFTCTVSVTLFSHGDAAPIVETHWRLDHVDQDNVERILA
jgi:hypothetical protein